ncbi:hypothetical protein DV735_g1755, partial [Chaetothyriales sp. CBS 134920]
MLATIQPPVFMDTYRHHSDYSQFSRARTCANQATQPRLTSVADQHPAQQAQPQLPSFREVSKASGNESWLTSTQILPPTLRSATATEINTQGPSNPAPEQTAGLQQAPILVTSTGLPSPNYSPSTSMPECFDDFIHRQLDSSAQTQNPQRSQSVWPASSQPTDMAAAYSSQRTAAAAAAYQGHSLASSRQSPGLPPIRDLNQGLSKYPANYDTSYISSAGSHTQLYAGTAYANQDPSAAYGRRDSVPYYDTVSRGFSQTYPPSGSQLGMPRDMSGLSRGYVDYNNPQYGRQAYDHGYGYHSMAMGGVQGPLTTGSMLDPSDGRNRRRRGNLPKHITDILRSWFQDHLDHPYPSEEEKQMFIAQTGLTLNQISNWFINARRRQLPALKAAKEKEIKAEAEARHQIK